MLPPAVIPFSAAGTGACHGEATINRDLSFVADANACCGKCKVAVTVNSYVVVAIMKLVPSTLTPPSITSPKVTSTSPHAAEGSRAWQIGRHPS